MKSPNQELDDKLSPESVIREINVFLFTLRQNWAMLILLPVTGCSMGYGVDYFVKKVKIFEAKIVFAVGAENSDNSIGSMARLAGAASPSTGNTFTGENFFYFVKSRPVIERTLMKEVVVDGKRTQLANLVIDSSRVLTQVWDEHPELRNVHFSSSDISGMDMNARRLLNHLIKYISEATEIRSINSKSSFISLSTRMENEQLAGLWLITLLKTGEEIYIENQTERTRKTLTLLQNRADSLARVLGSAENRLAKHIGFSEQITLPEAKVSSDSMTVLAPKPFMFDLKSLVYRFGKCKLFPTL